MTLIANWTALLARKMLTTPAITMPMRPMNMNEPICVRSRFVV